MRAVVLAGGLGLRLRPYTTILPKPLVPVGDRPILEHILVRLATAGITRIDLCVSHLGELIQAYFSQATTMPAELELRFHWEESPLGTAGAIRSVPDLGGTFIVMNGDVLTTLDFARLVEHHRDERNALTIATQTRSVPIALGVVDTQDGQVTAYREKPEFLYDASMGIYVYDERVLDHLEPGEPCQFPELVHRLMRAGERVGSFHTQADVYDIGTFAELRYALQALDERPEAFELS